MANQRHLQAWNRLGTKYPTTDWVTAGFHSQLAATLACPVQLAMVWQEILQLYHLRISKSSSNISHLESKSKSHGVAKKTCTVLQSLHPICTHWSFKRRRNGMLLRGPGSQMSSANGAGIMLPRWSKGQVAQVDHKIHVIHGTSWIMFTSPPKIN